MNAEETMLMVALLRELENARAAVGGDDDRFAEQCCVIACEGLRRLGATTADPAVDAERLIGEAVARGVVEVVPA